MMLEDDLAAVLGDEAEVAGVVGVLGPVEEERWAVQLRGVRVGSDREAAVCASALDRAAHEDITAYIELSLGSVGSVADGDGRVRAYDSCVINP